MLFTVMKQPANAIADGIPLATGKSSDTLAGLATCISVNVFVSSGEICPFYLSTEGWEKTAVRVFAFLHPNIRSLRSLHFVRPDSSSL